MDVRILNINYDKWMFMFQLKIMINGCSCIKY